MTNPINQLVTVTSVHFTKQFETIPRRIELDGVSYSLEQDYKKTEQGTDTIFDISDGIHLFRLRKGESISSWLLMSITLPSVA